MRFRLDKPDTPRRMSLALSAGLRKVGKPGLVIVCIGTDRSTGDSLGPLVGTFLQKAGSPVPVYGNLDDPVHATNLADKAREVRRGHPGAVVVAVDACLGDLDNVGTICVSLGPLRPGAGVGKNQGKVGDLRVVGVVNTAGFMEYFVLQNTRLSLVVNIARVIAESIMLTVAPGASLEVAATKEAWL